MKEKHFSLNFDPKAQIYLSKDFKSENSLNWEMKEITKSFLG